MSEFLAKINLFINAEKSSCIVFRFKKSKVYSTSVKFLGQPLLNVRECKYLGVMLTETLSMDKDVDRMPSSFLKQFNSLFSNFKYIDRKVLTFLFRTYTSLFYG